MTFEEWFEGKAKYLHGDAADLAYEAWQAAYSQGKADIKEPFIRLSAALSQIDYLLGEPNDMGTSLYDLDYAEDRVVARARQFIEDAKERERKAYRAGQEDMRERAALKVESFVGWASDHNLECRGEDIRALEIAERAAPIPVFAQED